MLVGCKKCNELTGKEWLQNSFSIWRNLTKTKEEKNLNHPACYPVALCERLIRTFSKCGCNVLDPFSGVGSTMVAAHNLHCFGTGIELSCEFTDIAKSRTENDPNLTFITGDSFQELDKLKADSFDICITSPPYWNILNMKRSADRKKSVNYSKKENDLGNVVDYEDFVKLLTILFEKVNNCLKVGSYCIINVMDIRKKSTFYPLHMDLTAELRKKNYILDDIIIWDRQVEYNNMRPLGYPYKFRINKVHEYLLIFIKECAFGEQ